MNRSPIDGLTQNAPPPSLNAVDFGEVLRAIRRDRWLISAIVLCSIFLFVGSTFFLKKKYKSSAQITIYTEYFQNPLIKDFLPETYEINELRSQRETLVKSTFDPRFIDELGEKYGLFKSDRDTTQRIIERQLFAKNIDVYMIAGTTAQIDVVGSDPNVDFRITGDIVERAKLILTQERRKLVEGLRNSIRSRIEAMAISQNPSADPLATGRPEALRAELGRIEAQIEALSQQYTSRHPAVQRLQSRASLIRSMLKRAKADDAPVQRVAASSGADDQLALGGESRETSHQVYDDLSRKLSYLNIVLDMNTSAEENFVSVIQAPTLPTAAIFPRRSVFALWGLLAGLMTAMLAVLLREYFERTAPKMEEFAARAGVSYLGSLPTLELTPKKPEIRELHDEWH